MTSTPAYSTVGGKPVVICLGDSHTRGFLGASWVNILAARHPSLHFVNAGMDSHPSHLILKRLPPLLRRYPNPLAVLLLPGSNDNIGMNSTELQWFYRLLYGAGSRGCSFEMFEQNTRAMLEILQSQAPNSKVILMTLPPSTEQPSHPGNRRIPRFTSIAQQLAGSFPAVTLVDFSDVCVAFLQRHSSAWKQAAAAEPAAAQPDASNDAAPQADQQQQQQPHSPQQQKLFRFSVARCGWLMTSSVLLHYGLGRSWDAIGRTRGLLLLVDQVHLNDTAAKLLAEQLEPLVQQLEQQAQAVATASSSNKADI